MMGLLVKDMRLIKQQQRKLLIILLPLAIMLHVITEDDGSFVIGYLTFVCSFVAFSSVTYDEFENGYAFLMTLPIKRRQYVAEKYLFSVLVCSAAWIVGCLVSVGSCVVKNHWSLMQNTMLEAMVIFFAVMIFLAISLPLHLQFGSEKAKIVTLGVWGAGCLVIYLSAKLAKQKGIDLEQMASRLLTRNVAGMGVLLAAITIVVMVFSLLVSTSIMNKKEF